MSPEIFEGGCLCGATRFRVAGPAAKPCYCHCQSCRGAAGAPFVAWATFASASFRITRGELARHRSSERVTRGFCPACGTALTYHNEELPEELDVTLVALDEASSIRPERHIWVSHKLPWVELGDRLPRHAEWREGGGHAP